MKYIFIIFTVFLFSCASKTENKALVEKKALAKMEKTFPFSESERVEIISYPVRYTWDTIPNANEGVTTVENIVIDKTLRIKPSGIKERFFLNNDQKVDLYKILYKKDNPECTVSTCYDPRHAILFYNDRSEIIAYIEICFDCGIDYASDGFDYNELCREGLSDVRKIFEKAGIKYYGEGQE